MNAPPQAAAATIARRLLDLAWPIIGLNVLNVLALAVDTAMVGRLVHAEYALAGMGYATQVAFLLMVAMLGLSVGAVAFVARAHGAGASDRVDHILLQASQLAVLVGLSVAILGNLVARPLLVALGAQELALEAGLSFLRPLLMGSVFNNLILLYAAVLRGVGLTRLPFQVALVYNGLNFAFNYALILGHFGIPPLGIRGAAYGTVLAQALGALLLVVLLHRGSVPNLHLPLRPKPIDWVLARDLARVGAPAALDLVVLNATFLSIIGMLGRIDQVAVAAHGIGLRIQALAFVPGMSVSQATAAMVGQALGAGNVAEAKNVLRASILLGTAIMTAVALLVLGMEGPILALFDVAGGTPMSAFATTWLRLLGVCMPLAGVHIAYAGLFSGAGATRTSLAINIASTFLVQIPSSAALGFGLGWGAAGVWAGFPLAFVLKIALDQWAYRRELWARTGLKA